MESESPSLNFIVPPSCQQNFNNPLSLCYPLTGWLHFSTAPLTFGFLFECIKLTLVSCTPFTWLILLCTLEKTQDINSYALQLL